ncbi:MAG: hypothetical protein M1834_004297 [Cirrosporium novae-zelandiae]|nr:MAG: hypothetical protein M1834_004297 [Cirrosporium novae-zelandiae]
METVPTGIVTSSRGITSEIENIGHVEYEDIMRMWRTFAISKVAHESGGRLSNLFWRISGTESIHRNIHGSTVANLFARIMEGGVVRDTLIQSSHSARRFSHTRGVIPPPHFEIPPEPTPGSDRDSSEAVEDSVESSSPPKPKQRTQSKLPLPPILKKPRSGLGEGTTKTARIVSPTPDDDTNGSPEKPSLSTVRPQRPETDQKELSSKAKGKRPAFLVNYRRRPAMPRRKSSQTVALSNLLSGKTSPRSPPQSAPLSPSLEANEEESAENPNVSRLPESALAPPNPKSQSRQKTRGFSLPLHVPPPRSRLCLGPRVTGEILEPDLYIDTDTPSHHPLESPESPEVISDMNNMAPLVDRDFRSKFAEKRANSAAQLSTLSNMASTKKGGTPDIASASRNINPTGSGEPSEVVKPLNFSPYDVTSQPGSLPRTKSLLTMGLEATQRSGKASKSTRGSSSKSTKNDSSKGSTKSTKGKERARRT